MSITETERTIFSWTATRFFTFLRTSGVFTRAQDQQSRQAKEKAKDIPFFARQVRTILCQNEKVDPRRILTYIAEDGYTALSNVLANWKPAMVVEEIKEVLPRLTRNQILELDDKIHDYLETSLLTRGSEKSFCEWEDPEEDIYNVDV
jgi:hypothetical protein